MPKNTTRGLEEPHMKPSAEDAPEPSAAPLALPGTDVTMTVAESSGSTLDPAVGLDPTRAPSRKLKDPEPSGLLEIPEAAMEANLHRNEQILEVVEVAEEMPRQLRTT